MVNNKSHPDSEFPMQEVAGILVFFIFTAMPNRWLSIVVLTCMTLHSCGRLGVISYLYSSRFEIAHGLGLTTEKEISICKSDHFQHTQLTLASEKERPLPADSAQSQEINLFTPPSAVLVSIPNVSPNLPETPYIARPYPLVYSGIFHPPGRLA